MKKVILIIIVQFLLGCNILIKDDPNTGVNYTPIEYNVESIEYIKDYNNNKFTWSMRPSGSVDVVLDLIFPLTDRTNIKVKDLKESQNNIFINLEASPKKSSVLKKPIIKLTLKGINPYKKLDYNINVDANFDFINTNLESDDVKNIVIKNSSNVNYNPQDVLVYKSDKKIKWSLTYPIVITNDSTIFKKMQILIDDDTEEITDKSFIDISRNIAKGKPIGFLNNETFILNKTDGAYAYYIPKNELIKINYNLKEGDIVKKDLAQEKIYIYSKNRNGDFLIINSDLSVENLRIGEYHLSDFAVNNGVLFFNTDNNKRKVYKYNLGETSLFAILKNDILNMDTNGVYLAVECQDKPLNNIFLIDNNSKTIYIGKGNKPTLNDKYISYLRIGQKTKSSELINYSLNTGITNAITHGDIENISYINDKLLLIKENAESYFMLSTFENDILKQMIHIPKYKSYISSSLKYIIINYYNSLWLINLFN